MCKKEMTMATKSCGLTGLIGIVLILGGTFSCQSKQKQQPDNSTSNEEEELSEPSHPDSTNDKAFMNEAGTGECGYDAGSGSLLNQTVGATGIRVKAPIVNEIVVNVSMALSLTSQAAQFGTTLALTGGLSEMLKGSMGDYETIDTWTVVSAAEAQSYASKMGLPSACGLMASRSFSSVTKSQKYYIKISYNKPFFFFVNPLLSKSRVEQELKTPIRVEGIVASIESNNPMLNSEAKTRTGVTELRLIPASAVLSDDSGRQIQVAADYAVRFTSQFDNSSNNDGSPLASLNQTADYYIQGGKIAAILVKIHKSTPQTILYTK
jgi:hypothetical protein